MVRIAGLLLSGRNCANCTNLSKHLLGGFVKNNHQLGYRSGINNPNKSHHRLSKTKKVLIS